MTTSRKRVLLIIAIFTALTVVLGACKRNTSSETNDGGDAADNGAEQISDNGGASNGGSNGGGDGASGGSNKSTQGSDKVPGSTNPPSPPKEGTYAYDRSQNNGDLIRGTLEIDPAVATANGKTQRTDRQHASTSTVAHFLYNPTGIFLTIQGAPNGDPDCTLKSPIPFIKWPLGIGNKWSGSSACTSGGTSFDITGSVTRTETVKVGSEQVPTFVVFLKQTRSDSSGKLVNERTLWFSPVHGIHMKSTNLATAPDGGKAALEEFLIQTEPFDESKQ